MRNDFMFHANEMMIGSGNLLYRFMQYEMLEVMMQNSALRWLMMIEGRYMHDLRSLMMSVLELKAKLHPELL